MVVLSFLWITIQWNIINSALKSRKLIFEAQVRSSEPEASDETLLLQSLGSLPVETRVLDWGGMLVRTRDFRLCVALSATVTIEAQSIVGYTNKGFKCHISKRVVSPACLWRMAGVGRPVPTSQPAHSWQRLELSCHMENGSLVYGLMRWKEWSSFNEYVSKIRAPLIALLIFCFSLYS